MQPVNQLINLDEYQGHPRNYNRHPDQQVQRIMASLRKFGQPRSVVVWRGQFLAGHGVAEAARQLGWKQLRADVLPDDYPEHLALAYVVADNELARQSDPDQAALAAILQEVGRVDAELVEAAGFGEKELSALLASLTPAGAGGDTPPQVDRAEELRQKWQVEPGQLWVMGEHRLIVGDCTDKATVERVMGGERADMVFTDPPYGMALETDWSDRIGTWERNTNRHAPVMGDDKPFDRRTVPVEAKEEFWWGADYYVDTLLDFGKDGSWLVWDKRKEGSLDDMRGNAFELCWSKNKHRRELIRVTWVGVLGHDKKMDGERKFHPTQKPVKLAVEIIGDYTEPSSVVFDGFAGSGFVGVACHNLGRKARMIEISPAYCAVILERMQAHTNQSPTLVEAS